MSVATMRVLSVVFVLAAASPQVVAQQFVCHPIRSGDTVARLALRLTGDPENRHKAWFRIVDPAASRVISKSQYHVIRPGWLACIATEPLGRSSTRLNNEVSASVQAPLATTDFRRRLEAGDLAFVGWWAAFCFVMTLVIWSVAEWYFQKTQTTVERMTRFGDTFIREFERPLVQHGFPGRPVRSRLRCMPHRGRLDIFLAPDGGRCYPNLSDHRKNVEYDVERITRGLRDEPFSSGPLYAQGQWVVIPFQLQAEIKTEGAL